MPGATTLTQTSAVQALYLLGISPGQKFGRIVVGADGSRSLAWYIVDRNGNTKMIAGTVGTAATSGTTINFYNNNGTPSVPAQADRFVYSGVENFSFIGLQYTAVSFDLASRDIRGVIDYPYTTQFLEESDSSERARLASLK